MSWLSFKKACTTFLLLGSVKSNLSELYSMSPAFPSARQHLRNVSELDWRVVLTSKPR